MTLKNYFHVLPDVLEESGKVRNIGSTLESRKKYMSDVMYNLYKEDIHNNIQPKGKTAFLYVIGAAFHHSHIRSYPVDYQKENIPVFAQSGYIASKLAKRFNNISYLNIDANACASSMHALYDAERLLKSGFDDVIIYAEEWSEPEEILLFKSLNIDIVCSDGFAVFHLSNEGDGVAEISNTNWHWNPDSSPFNISTEGYIKVLEPFKNLSPEVIKMHGSGTNTNDLAENKSIDIIFSDKMERISIKREIGHTQGASALVEIAEMLSRKEYKNFVSLASGLGNFYGSCFVKRI